jgi:hypothetical protein
MDAARMSRREPYQTVKEPLGRTLKVYQTHQPARMGPVNR